MAEQLFRFDDGTEKNVPIDDNVFEAAMTNPEYAKQLHAQVQRAEYLNRRIDYTPFKYKRKLHSVRGGLLSEALNESKDEEFRKQTLAAGGIAVGAGPFSRAEIDYFQSLSKDFPHEFARAFIPKVKEKIAPDEDVDPSNLVKVGEDGKVRFLNLKTRSNPTGTNRWTEFHGFGVDPFNVLELGLDIVGSYAGARGAKAANLKPVKEAALTGTGAAAGASIAESARNILAEAHGVTDKTGLETAGSIAGRASLAGGGSLVGSAIGRGYYNLTSTPNPYFFNQRTSEAFEQSLSQGDETVEAIRKLKGGEDFSPDLAQTTGEKSLLTLRATLLNRAGGTSEMKTAAGLLTRDDSNNRILNNALDNLLAGKKVTAEEAGAAVKAFNLEAIEKLPPAKQAEALRNLYNENILAGGKLGPIRETAELGRASLIRRLRGDAGTVVKEGPPTDATGLEKVLRGYKEAEATAWGDYERLAKEYKEDIGFPLEIDIRGVFPQLKGFIDKAAVQWDPVAKARFAKVLDPLTEAAAQNEGRASLFAVNANLSEMKETLRAVSKSANTDAQKHSVSMLEAAISSLQKTRDNYLVNVAKRPDIADALLAAENTTKRVHDLTKRSVASKFLGKNRAGQYAIVDPDKIFQDVMVPGNPEGMRQWMDIVKDDPRMVQATKDWYGQHYHHKVMENGLANPTKHREWMRDNGAAAKLLFNEKEFGYISRLGGISHAIKVGENNLAKLEQAVALSSNGKIRKMDPEKVVNSLLGVSAREGSAASATKLQLSEVGRVVNTLKTEAPETFALVQDRTKEMIRTSLFGDQATKQATKLPNVDTLGKFLEESQQARLSLIMGEQFVADLRQLKRGLEIMERSGKGTPLPHETPALSLFRVVFGPLSRTQRFISGARRYSIIGQEQKLAEIISDPAKLRAVMKAANAPAQSPFAMSTLTSLGLLEATN